MAAVKQMTGKSVKQVMLFGDEEDEDREDVSLAVSKAEALPSPLAKPVNNQRSEPVRCDSQPRARRTSRETFRITYGGMSREVSLWIERRGKDHWICGLPLRGCSEAGPYTSQDEAEEDKAGLRRFWEENGRYADWGA